MMEKSPIETLADVAEEIARIRTLAPRDAKHAGWLVHQTADCLTHLLEDLQVDHMFVAG